MLTILNKVLPLAIPCFFFFCFSTEAQTRKQFRAKAIDYLVEKQADSAEYFSQFALELSPSDRQKADIGLIIGQIKQLKGNRNDVIHYYDSLNDRFLELGFEPYLAYSYRDVAIAYDDIGKIDKALGYFQKSYRLFKEFKDERNALSLLNSIAISVKRGGDFLKAKEYFNEVIESFMLDRDSAGVTLLFNGLGNLYLDFHKPDSALMFFKSSLSYQTWETGLKRKSISFFGIGEAFRVKAEYDSALHYFQVSLELKKQVLPNRGLSRLHHSLAELYLDQGNLQLAEEHIIQAKKIAENLGLGKELATNALLSSGLYEAFGDLKVALKLYKQHSMLEDSLLNLEKARSLSEMQTRFGTSKMQDDLNNVKELRDKIQIGLDNARELMDKQDKTLKQQEYTIDSLIVVVSALLIITLLLFQLYRLKQKQKKMTEWQMREQHHRVGNNIAVLSTLLNQAGAQANTEEAKTLALEGKIRLEAMNLLHGKLYWKDEVATIPLKPFIEELSRQILSLYIPYSQHAISFDIENVTLPVRQAIPFSLILNEILTNACKYGLKNTKKPRLEIQLSTQKGQIELSVKNNGLSLPDAVTERQRSIPSFGYTLIETLSKQLKGVFSIEFKSSYAIGRFEMPASVK